MRNRDGFNRLIADALDGKINLILTKSLSRFARNTVDTVDSLTTIRKLKAVGVAMDPQNTYHNAMSFLFLSNLQIHFLCRR